jgi:putative ABC transport system permease protein
MFRSYLKTALRHFSRQKGYTFINMFGMTVGLTCCIVIFLYVSDELSYDKYHADLDRIYRVASRVESPNYNASSAQTSGPVAQVLRDNFLQVEKVAQVFRVNAGLMEKGETKYFEDTRIFCDPELFQILTIPFLKGDPQTALNRPYTMVLSERIAKKYFDQQDPLGQTITLNTRDYEVTAIVADAPHNTHLKYDFFVSMKTLEGRYPFDRWFLSNFYIYVKLNPSVEQSDFEKLLGPIAHTYAPKELVDLNEKIRYFLQPVGDIHLYSHLRNESEPGMNPLYLYILSAIGLLVLMIACMNFINLSTARSTQRAREVGVRKVVGAVRGQLARQFFGESLVIIVLALACALLLAYEILPLVNSIDGKTFTVSALLQPSIFIFLVGLVVFVSIAASAYPSLFLSRFQAVKVLKINFLTAAKGSGLRKVLVVSQFAISIALIAGTLVIYKQLHFMKNQYLGFDKEQKLIIPVRGMLSIEENYETVKAAFSQHTSITDAAVSSKVIGQRLDRWSTELVGREDEEGRVLNHMYVGPDFLNLYKIELLAGRHFSLKQSTDANGAFILNRTAAAEFGWSPEEALEKRLDSVVAGEVIGVVEDFHYMGLQASIEPLAIFWGPEYFSNITLNISTENLPEALAFAENKWKELFPGNPFDYFFLDTYFNRHYQAEERIGKMFTVFTILGVIIACLGLFGLASFTAERKTKEIGIRKVLGASVSEIVFLLSKEIIKWVIIANLIAWPLVYAVMNHWLSNFAYRINVNLGILVGSAFLALAIALVTVSFQSVKAACANPLDALKYE